MENPRPKPTGFVAPPTRSRRSRTNQTLSVMTFDVIRVLERDVNMITATPPPDHPSPRKITVPLVPSCDLRC
jgi:hypothetical protein